MLRIGKINRSHGIKGEVKVTLDTKHTEIFSDLDCCYLIYRDKKVSFHLEQVRSANRFWLFKFREVNDRNQADELKDFGVYVDESYLPPLAEGEFFIHDLIGCAVYSIDDEYLGEVFNYFENGEHGVCEVKNERGIFLFPLTDEIFQGLSVAEKKIVIQPVPGLVELNR